MVKASRNNLCPCGSGKTYKHCCGKKEAVSIESLIDREVAKCMQDVFSFALERYEEELAFMMSGSPFQGLPNELETSANLLLTNWAIFHRHVDDKGMTIFSAYMRSRRRNRWRPAVQAHLERWTEGIPSFGEIVRFDEERRLMVRDLVSGEEKRVRFLTSETVPPAEEGDVLLGFLLPYGEEFTYFIAALPFPKSGRTRLAHAIEAERKRSGKAADAFWRTSFPEALDLALNEWLWQLSAELEWNHPDEEEVLHELKRREEKTSPRVLSHAAFFWRMYCEQEEPVIDDPIVYAAALRHVAGQMAEEEFMDVEEAAARYGVPAEEVESTSMEFILFAVEMLDRDEDGEWDEDDEEWLDDEWDFEEGMIDGDELDAAIDEWLDDVEELFDDEGWDTDQVHRLIDKAMRTWKKDGLLEGVDEAELREELEELVWQTFAGQGFC
ncbi:SEC-C metal-binding domain-containing protein [Geobacillus subterraneus]|uniref:SEC-C metal-binding domain-containing protein n=1 Tax=Geobacillus subterraneus TaxID=129338 RepID=UPI0038F6D67E